MILLLSHIRGISYLLFTTVFSFAVQVLKGPLLVLPARFDPITAKEGDVDIDLKDRLGCLGMRNVNLVLALKSKLLPCRYWYEYSRTDRVSIVTLRRCHRDTLELVNPAPR